MWPPINAGPDAAVRGGQEVTLDGSESFDPDGGPLPLSFTWTFVVLPAGSARINADIREATTATPRFTPDVGGAYLLRVQVSDGAKNDADNVLIFVDDTPPTMQFVSPLDGATVDTSTPTFYITFSDSGAGLDLDSYKTFVNGIEVAALVYPTGATYTPASPLPAGDNQAVAQIADRAGNVRSVTIRFTVAVFRAIADCAPTSGTVPLPVTFRTRGEFTGGSIVRYRWDFQGNGVFDTSDAVARDITFTFTQAGTFIAVLEVLNNLGAIATDTCTIVARGNVPTATANAAPSNGAVPLTVNLTCVGSDPDGTIARYQWDFEGDGVFDFSSTTTGTTSHAYTAEGTFVAVCRVTDNTGLTGDARTTTTVIRSGPPGSPSVVATASPASGNAPLNVSFNGSATDNGTIVLWEWDFDGNGTFDFTSAVSPATTFRYTNGGIFAAALRATDNTGLRSIDTVEVVVNLTATVSIANETFNPTAGQTISIQSTLSAGVPVHLFVKDQDDTVVRTLVNTFRAAGSYTDTWNGQDNSGHLLPQGVYFAVLEYDFAGTIRRIDPSATTGGVRSNPPRTTLPLRFSPLAGQPLAIDFTLARAAEVTAFMGRFNVDTRLVTFMERVPLGRGTHRIVWNGENANGQLIHPPSGDSFLFGIFSYTLPTNALFLDGGAEVAGLTVAPSIFDPSSHVDAQGTPERSTLAFTLSRTADVELVVSDAKTGVTVARRFFPGLAIGSNLVTWDGRDDTGTLVAPGRYRLGVAAIDRTGHRSLRLYALQRIYY